LRSAWRFYATVFLSAFLLFQVQPIAARYLLPEFGGTPAVWSACLLFFQAVLLAGYAYAHALPARSHSRWVHLILLAATAGFLPIAIRPSGSGGDPTARILALLALSVGAPYFLLSSTAPLIQRWFAAARPAESPWRLYALSNFGSFLALLTYPFLIEPYVPLGAQLNIWSGLYAAFLALCGYTAWAAREGVSARAEPVSQQKPAPRIILLWLALSTAASIILLATTNEISQEIAVNPFLWVAPLSLYLLTFVLTFESDRWYNRAVYAGLAGLFTAVACSVSAAANAIPVLWQLGVYLLALFFACMLSNGELVRSRPEPRYLTTFYLCVAAGGALGGVFVALIAPRVFTEFSEFPIGYGAACALGLICWVGREGFGVWKGFDVRVPLSSLLLGVFTAVAFLWIAGGEKSLVSVRNFYGILRVTESTDQIGLKRTLTHGRIDHGFEYVAPDKRDWPTSYYGPHSGVALALGEIASPRRIGVVGLGAGTIAAWGRGGDAIRFYEINPAVIRIANTWFWFLKDSKAHVETVLGDARVQLTAEATRGARHDFDAIAVDAFSSDSIPMHLLTTECADVYRSRLKPGGVLLLHITNKTLDLAPVARGLAIHLGWQAEQITTQRDEDTGESASQWVAIASDVSRFTQNSGWTALAEPPLTWTDNFSSLWRVLRF
jgi:hypothetical protein